MELLLDDTAVRIVLMVAGVLGAFVVARSMLRASLRLIRVGCLSLAGLALVLWLINWVT